MADELEVSTGLIYKWRVTLDEQAKAVRVAEFEAQGASTEMARLLLQKDEEIQACQVMGLGMSTYYSDPKIGAATKEERDADLRGKIEQIRIEFPRAGYWPLLHYLRRSGIIIGETKLRRLIKQFELQIRSKRKFIKTTDSNHPHDIQPNLIQGILLDGINQVWASDITYIRIENGFVF